MRFESSKSTKAKTEKNILRHGVMKRHNRTTDKLRQKVKGRHCCVWNMNSLAVEA